MLRSLGNPVIDSSRPLDTNIRQSMTCVSATSAHIPQICLGNGELGGPLRCPLSVLAALLPGVLSLLRKHRSSTPGIGIAISWTLMMHIVVGNLRVRN